MARKPVITRFKDGSIELRTRFPRELAVVFEQLAKDFVCDERVPIRMMLDHIAGMFANGKADYFGPVFQRALKAALQANLGVITPGPAIDLSKLHKSNKTKSGYVGVYLSGKGFRAMAKVKGIETYLGTFETAEEAAWKRRLHYVEKCLPYGELEADMDAMRAQGFAGDEDALVDAVIQTAKDSGTYHTIANDVAEYQRNRGKQVAIAEEDLEEPGMIGFSKEKAETLMR